MKRITILTTPLISALAFSGAVFSGHGFIGKARVIEAQPLYETVEVAYPVTECWTERVARYNPRYGSYIAPVAGGIVGGVIGHQFGKGRGKTAMTVAGTLLGASLGHGYNTSHHRQRPTIEDVEHCETIDRYEQQQRLVGYRVKYRYEGQTHYMETTEHPGKHLPVLVRVTPVNGV